MTDNETHDAQRDAAASPLSASGGSIGAEATKDVSSGHAVCTRDQRAPSDPPGNPQAIVKPATAREFEQALRTLGFTRREANLVASHGFKALAPGAEPEEDRSELAALLGQRSAPFK